MGLEPGGKSADIVTFKDGKIMEIKSISGVLGRFIQLCVLERSMPPVEPYE